MKGFELPLLKHASLSDAEQRQGEVIVAAGEARVRATELVLRQERLYSFGTLLYCSGFVVGAGSNWASKGLGGWLWALFGVMQTAGLICMTVANIDADLHYRRRPIAAALVALTLVLFAGTPSFSSEEGIINAVLWLPALPFIYLLLPSHFLAVLRADSPTLPSFTQLLLASLALNLLGTSVYCALKILITGSDFWAAILVECLVCLVGAIATIYGFLFRRKKGDSPTLSLNYAIFVYLLAYGVAELLFHVTFQLEIGVDYPIGYWFFGPIHILPATALLFKRGKAYRWLARAQLHRASVFEDLEGVRIPRESGNIQQVEQAITMTAKVLHTNALCSYVPLSVNASDSEQDVESYTLLHLASWNGHADSISAILNSNAISRDCTQTLNFPTRIQQQSALMLASRRGHIECVKLLLLHGASVHQRAADGTTALTSAIAANQLLVLQLLLEYGNSNEIDMQRWMGMDNKAVALLSRRQSTALLQVLRAYESEFMGNILSKHGGACVASWPGIYAELWDKLVAKGKRSELSAAVVFLPEHTRQYGEHGSDRCFCVEMYGEIKPWGCKVSNAGLPKIAIATDAAMPWQWFEIWRMHIETAVAHRQTLQVYYFEGFVGKGRFAKSTSKQLIASNVAPFSFSFLPDPNSPDSNSHAGKIASWAACRDDAVKRTSLAARKQAFLKILPAADQTRLQGLSRQPKTSAIFPGTNLTQRWEEEEKLFIASLSTEERAYMMNHIGLGNSQKAEVAWLEEKGYAYEECDVRSFLAQ